VTVERNRELMDLQDTVVRLREENEALRRSAGAFGELAERLSYALDEERRRIKGNSGAADNRGLRPQH
jgi:hypothetical protein